MATIRGFFPVLDQPAVNIREGREYRRINGVLQTTVIPAGSTEYLYSDIINGMWNHTDYNADSNARNWYGPVGVSISGEPLPVPPSRLLTGPIIKVNNSNFEARVKRGEMVVSDYQRFSAFLIYANGGTKIPGTERTLEYSTGVLRGNFKNPTFLSAGVNDQSWSLRPESEALHNTLFKKVYRQMTFEDDKTPYNVGWDDSIIQKFLDNFSIPDEIHNLVTENTSDANMATVDILTSLAELPETVGSVFKGLVALKKLFVDAKNKNVSLLNKAKRVRVQYERAFRRREFELRQEWLAARNARERSRIDKEIRRTRAQLKNDLDRSWRDFLSGVAQVELTVRYGILPVKYTIDGLVEIMLSQVTEYVRWSSRKNLEIDPPLVPGFKSTGKISVELRAFIKRQFDAVKGFAEKLKYLSGSLIVTAYELIPLSFVLDWFVQIGTLLQSFFGSNLSDYKEAATISLKIGSGDISYIHEESGCNVTVNFKGYTRKVINPRDYCRLSSTVDVSGYRIYDALALSWQLIVKKLIPQLKQDVKIS